MFWENGEADTGRRYLCMGGLHSGVHDHVHIEAIEGGVESDIGPHVSGSLVEITECQGEGEEDEEIIREEVGGGEESAGDDDGAPALRGGRAVEGIGAIVEE